MKLLKSIQERPGERRSQMMDLARQLWELPIKELAEIRRELAHLDGNENQYSLAMRDMLASVETERAWEARKGICGVCGEWKELWDGCAEHRLPKMCSFCANDHAIDFYREHK